MPPKDNLLKNFDVSEETASLARQLLRTAQRKTGPGSGRELRELSTGLSAACVFVACERLNTTEYSRKSAQVASCLKPTDFRKVYEAVKAVVEEEDKASAVSYNSLHQIYKSTLYREKLAPFILKTEKKLIRIGTAHSPESKIFVCAVYFWVLGVARPKDVPGTQVFAAQHELPIRKFTNVLDLLNDNCNSLRIELQGLFKQAEASASKAQNTPTPRASPRKAPLRELPSKDSPKKLPQEATTDASEQSSPTRRSLRNSSSIPDSPTKSTMKATSLQPHTPSRARQPWKKAPIRELPSKDSPKKRAIDMPPDESDVMDVDEELPQTPTKKRRATSPSKTRTRESLAAFEAALSTPTSSRLMEEGSPSKRKAPATLFPAAPGRSSPLKRQLVTALDGLSSSESDDEGLFPRRRFRPVYLEHRQWNARDPRLLQVWKKVEELRNGHVHQQGHKAGRPSPRQTIDL